MTTKIIEFKNPRGNTLRGVLIAPTEQYDRIVIMLGGFERAASTERKFKLLSDELSKSGVHSFRFDVADMGLSDGNFYEMTSQDMANDLLSAIETIKNLGYGKISFAGHSHASCNLSLVLNKVEFDKILLIAPALNQKELWRLWFVQDENPDKQIGWRNYKEYLDENKFLETLSQDIHSKNHILGPKMKQINVDIDFATNYDGFDLNKVLVVHGDADFVCPMESVTIDFPNKLVVSGGDHDMDQPEVIKRWLVKAGEFLIK